MTGGLSIIESVEWERPNYPRAIAIGESRAGETLLFVGGFVFEDGRRVATVWVVDAGTMQPLGDLQLKRHLRPAELETMSFKISAENDLCLLHVVNTKFLHFFRNEQFVGKVKANIPKEVSTLEMRGGFIFVGSALEDKVWAFKICEKSLSMKKPKLVDKRPVWGPARARQGVFALPNDENDVVTVCPDTRNNLLLFNCSDKDMEMYDSYDSGFDLAKISAMQGGILQSRNQSNNLFLLKLD